MAWKERKYRLLSDSPLLMHNGHLAAPGNMYSRWMKEITSKQTKTDADYEELSKLEFLGSLYMDDDGPILPAENIQAMIIRAAKGERKGKKAGAGIMVNEHSRLEYDGPRDGHKMWEDGRFAHTALVKIKNSKTLRTRAQFVKWEAVITVKHEDKFVNESEIDRWMVDAGVSVGLGDWRPEYYGRYGRFRVEILETEEAVLSANGKKAERIIA